ncbi:MAG TPA: hypothetical protein VHF05_01855 [Candidatus Paceibacterota bacterium]|jgi:hypothetical protein|nr:hypothetical protein [Candidatus Paceibacterota bacterium]
MPVLTQEFTKLEDWARAHDPSQTNLLFKNGFWDQIEFVRDQIPGIAYVACGLEAARYVETNIRVISTHVSKSVTLPVFHLRLPNGDQFVMRYNFHDWKVSVAAKEPIDADFMRLFNPSLKLHRAYCEGFPEEWIFGSYEADPGKFSVVLQSGYYYIFTFFWIYFQKVVAKRI